MKKIALSLTAIICIGLSASAQQSPMFTKYIFNGLAYNPGYAGSADVLSITAIHRHQWFLMDGGPMTQTLSVHSPLRNDKIGLGLNLTFDQIGVSKTFGVFGSYAYRIPLNGGNSHLALGVQGGFQNFRADFSKLNIRDYGDNAFYIDTSFQKPSYFLPNFGAGIYFQSKRFFVGFSAPQLLNNDLRKEGIVGNVSAQQYRHYFLSAGCVIPLSRNIDFRPIVLWKNVGMFFEKNTADQKVGAPNELDIDISFLFSKTLWLGAAFRTALESASSYDSVDFWAQYALRNGLRIGVAYDFPLTSLRGPGGGSYELMLGYDFNYNTNRIVTPRYF